MNGKSYAARRGGAYCMAGVIKGCGLQLMRDLDVLSELAGAISDKKTATKREGALFAYEALSLTLRR